MAASLITSVSFTFPVIDFNVYFFFFAISFFNFLFFSITADIVFVKFFTFLSAFFDILRFSFLEILLMILFVSYFAGDSFFLKIFDDIDLAWLSILEFENLSKHIILQDIVS